MIGSSRRATLLALAGVPWWTTLSTAAPAPALRAAHASDYLSGGLRGFVIGRLGDSLDDAYLDALSATGANLARVFWVFKRCARCDEFERSSTLAAELQRLLERARLRRLKLVVGRSMVCDSCRSC